MMELFGKQLAAKCRFLFPQKDPSLMFNKVINTPTGVLPNKYFVLNLKVVYAFKLSTKYLFVKTPVGVFMILLNINDGAFCGKRFLLLKY